MDYTSPGGAASDAFEKQMQVQAAQKRQALLDSLAAQKLASDMDFRKQEMEARHEEIESLRESRKSAAEEKAKGSFEKRVGNMVEGDVADPELLAQDKKFGTGYFRTAPPPLPAPIAGAQPMNIPGAVNPDTGAPANPAEAAPLVEPQAPADLVGPQPSVFVGNRPDRLKSTLDAKVKVLSDQLADLEPTDPKFKTLAVQYEMLTNKSLPAAFLNGKGGTSDSAPVMRQNTAKGSVERLIDGNWTTWTGDVPKGAHWMTEPQPKDTTAHDTAKGNALAAAKEHAYKDLDTELKPVISHLEAARDLTSMLGSKTPVTDKLVSPLVLKAIIAGNGSGFRMTRAEIDNVTHGRSRWDDLQTAFNKWSADPTQALDLSDTQRKDLQALAREVRNRAMKSHDALMKARDEVDDATEVEATHKARTKVKKSIGADLTEESLAADEAAGGAPVVGGMFQGGKVLSVTEVPKPKK